MQLHEQMYKYMETTYRLLTCNYDKQRKDIRQMVLKIRRFGDWWPHPQAEPEDGASPRNVVFFKPFDAADGPRTLY